MAELAERVPLADQDPELRPSGSFLGLVRRLEDPSVVSGAGAGGSRCVHLPPDPKQVARWRAGEAHMKLKVCAWKLRLHIGVPSAQTLTIRFLS